MKRSPASAWNFLLSLEGSSPSNPASSSSATAAATTSATSASASTSSPAPAAPLAPSPLVVGPLSSPSLTLLGGGVGGRASSTLSASSELLHLNDGVKLVIAMAGLPGRGKTHVARKVTNYFRWLGYSARHFEVASLRRAKLGPVKNDVFFDPSNEMGIEARTTIRNASMDAMISWLRDSGGQVAVYDTSNTTVEQRRTFTDRLRAAFPTPNSRPSSSSPTATAAKRQRTTGAADTSSESNGGSGVGGTVAWCRLIWIECGSEDPNSIQKDFLEATLASSDYQGLSRAEAMREFEKKSAFYLSTYVSLDSPGGARDDESYVKITELGRRVVARNVMGFLESKLVSFLMNIHIEPHVVYIARHGESVYNTMDRIGGDSPLTPAGLQFSMNLAKFIQKEEAAGWPGVAPGGGDESYLRAPVMVKGTELPSHLHAQDDEDVPSSELVVWTSPAVRAMQTADPVRCHVRVAWNALAELDAGACESMTYGEIQTKMPLEYAERQKDKFNWSYPRGESYALAQRRLESVIFEIERQRRPVLVVAHRAVARLLLGYFEGHAKDLIPYLPMQLHCVVKLSTSLRGGNEGMAAGQAWKSERFLLEPIVAGDLGAKENDVKVFQELVERRRAANTPTPPPPPPAATVQVNVGV